MSIKDEIHNQLTVEGSVVQGDAAFYENRYSKLDYIKNQRCKVKRMQSSWSWGYLDVFAFALVPVDLLYFGAFLVKGPS